MTNLFIFSLIISSYVFKVHTISFWNNQTIPNDILSRTFFDHVKNNKLVISHRDSGDSEKCILGLREIVNRFPSLDVFPFLDAWGRIPAGLLYGHLQDLGNFDECLDISTTLREPIGHTNGKYCSASVPLTDHQLAINPEAHIWKNQRRTIEEILSLTIGICVPQVCDADTLTEIFRGANFEILNGASKGIIVHSCLTGENPSIETINIIGIAIFSTIGLLMVLSTLYDIFADKLAKRPKQIYLAFSIITNARKLFKINKNGNSSNIDCLTGIRVLSMMWIILCHTYSWSGKLPFINTFEYLPWFKELSTMHIIMGTASVDTFFLMSGLLIAWLGLREMDKSNGKLNISLMYFHRCIRLTPPLIAVIIYNLSIAKYIGRGPIKEAYKEYDRQCKSYWWSTLLYIQNYVNPLKICIPQTWYLAVDTQLYFLSPLILIPLWKWGRKFVPVMIILSLLSMGYVMAVYFKNEFKTFMGVLQNDQFRLTYTATHARYTVWLIGIGLGYFMHQINSKSIRISKVIQFFCWSACLVLILVVIYGPYATIQAEREPTVLESAIFEALRRVAWGVALFWVIFACHFGFGGFINSFLSHEIWQPISRLTYSMYLLHFNVQIAHYERTKSDVYFSNYSHILIFWGTFGITLTTGIFFTLACEAPVLAIEKHFFKTACHAKDQKTNVVSKT